MPNFINYNVLKFVQIVSKVLFLVVLFALSVFGQVKTDSDIPPLTTDQPIVRELKGGEINSYKITLKAGEYFHVDVDQKGIDILLSMVGTENKSLIERDRPNGASGQETLSFIATKNGNYRLDVKSLDEKAERGNYEIRLTRRKTPTLFDKKRIEAETLFHEGMQLEQTQTSDAITKAGDKFEAAIFLWQEIGDKYAEALTQTSLGNIKLNSGKHEKAVTAYESALLLYRELKNTESMISILFTLGSINIDLGKSQKALDYFNQILSLSRTIGDKKVEAGSLLNIGGTYRQLGDNQKAVELFIQSLSLMKEIGDKVYEAKILYNIGYTFLDLGENVKSAEFFNQSLQVSQSIEDKQLEANSNNGLGLLYSSQGNKQKALEYFNNALTICKTTGYEEVEVYALNNIGLIYSDLGENQKALEFYNLALPIEKKLGDKYGEANVLNNIGKLYKELGENQKALEYYNLALPLYQSVDIKSNQAIVLNNIGLVYLDFGDNQKASEYFNQSLALSKLIGDKNNEARVLHNIALSYYNLNEQQKALEYYNLALPLRKIVGDRRGEAMTLSNIGSVYDRMGEKQKALELYYRALPIHKEVRNKILEAEVLANIMSVYSFLHNSQIAIFYGKQSINKYQELRQSIQDLDKQTQKTFIGMVEHTYRTLTNILIAENRNAEAVQVLNAFKDQQFFDFDQKQRKQASPLAKTLRETDFSSRLETTSERLGAFGERLEDLKRQIGTRQPTTAETSELKKIENNLKTASDEFLTVLKQAEIEFSKPKDEKDTVVEIPDLPLMQTALRQLNKETKQKVAVVYQLVGEDEFHLLVITADDVKKVSTQVKNSVLNEKALDFWALLQSPVYDPNLVGKELYDVVFKPLESVLPKDTKTILWSLDGNLRYVPMAALFDGKQYLAEKYNHVNFTRADHERMTRAVKPVWTATGLGTSEEKTVELLGLQISFDALPGVGEEFKLLFKPKTGSGGIFNGETFQNAAFNKKTMIEALKLKRPLVHIASHFSFRAGDEARSFLLLGDGTAFTLEEMKRETNLFEGVELLTLSACNTAAQQSGANGREIDGFAELAQRLGSNSVMATLWSVADCTTPWLMREFYNSKLNKNKNKAESLREAQIGLISGRSEIKSCPTRTDLSPIKIVVVENETERKKQPTRSGIYYLGKKNAPLWEKDKHPPFAHPFYWSPFILFGNWK